MNAEARAEMIDRIAGIIEAERDGYRTNKVIVHPQRVATAIVDDIWPQDEDEEGA